MHDHLRAEDADTICAVATPPGVGGISVIRVSGPSAAALARKLCRFLPAKLESHRIYYGICHSLNGEDLDEVLASYFADGRSFTGEETVEVSCHGGEVLTATILKELLAAGCRLAKPGEFTYRAFMSGRLDLVQAESVLGLIESQSRQSARVALRQLQGHLSGEFGRIENDLLWILAQLEANIDFSSEGIEVTGSDKLIEKTQGLIQFTSDLLKTYAQGRLLKDGIQIALAGKPNAGKSSVLNALLREERAIVTAEAGTTRDLVEGKLSFSGVPITFVDTAGLRETENEAERIGIERSRKTMGSADKVFFIIDLGSSDWATDLREFHAESSESALFIFNKVDLDQTGEWRSTSEAMIERMGLEGRAFWISARSRDGFQELESFIGRLAKTTDSESSNVITQARHQEQLQKIHSCLLKAHELIKRDSSPEFVAFELQESVRAIHELLGKEFHEQVIDRIFKEFCLGK
ncbi:MAG TPA: tRNA uridine-5-carboxymethylaminomethyl(34) synthesis GTPase MnmE [Bdellovibrionales bacterium]|nr:tRNA uridine-5-carboxymethylaminomethyl(34) synthesis GTPase MnmE [Bdellovibrionales bacterium]